MLPAGQARVGAQRPPAHAEIFRLLADVAGAPAGQHLLIGDLMRTVGPGANGMITSSRR